MTSCAQDDDKPTIIMEEEVLLIVAQNMPLTADMYGVANRLKRLNRRFRDHAGRIKAHATFEDAMCDALTTGNREKQMFLDPRNALFAEMMHGKKYCGKDFTLVHDILSTWPNVG